MRTWVFSGAMPAGATGSERHQPVVARGLQQPYRAAHRNAGIEFVGVQPCQRQTALACADRDIETERLIENFGKAGQSVRGVGRITGHGDRRGQKGNGIAVQMHPRRRADRSRSAGEGQRRVQPIAIRRRDDDRQPAHRHPGSFGTLIVRVRNASASISSNRPAGSSPKPVIARIASIAAMLPITPVSAPSTP